jgi:hypothetical protein
MTDSEPPTVMTRSALTTSTVGGVTSIVTLRVARGLPLPRPSHEWSMAHTSSVAGPSVTRAAPASAVGVSVASCTPLPRHDVRG